MDAPPIQYARTDDGVNIAYWTIGSGPPLLHLVNHAFSHVELEWRVPALRDWYEKMAGRFRVVRLDFRSSGLSDDVHDSLGIDAYVRDIEAVVRAIEVDRLAVFAISAACTVAMRFAARHPDDVASLALFAPWLRMPDSRRDAFEASRSMMRSDPDWWAKSFAATRSEQQDAGGHYERVIRNSISPEVHSNVVDAWVAIDVHEDAPKIRCPTLVTSGRFMQTPEVAREVATAIPSAQLAVFDVDAEDPYFMTPELALDTILSFVAEGFLGDAPVHDRGTVAPGDAAQSPGRASASAQGATGLTTREIEVTRLVAQGLSNNAIGEQLEISSGTATRHVHNILNKTGRSNRVELTRYAIERGLL